MAATQANPDPNAREAESDRFVKWIPIVVPLFALLIVALVYLIGAEVL
jgi:hypothetical protein